MCHPIFKMPSFYAHALNGLFLLIAILLVIMNRNELKRLKPSKMIIIVLLFSLGFGIHSLTHLGLEKVYGFNPINDVTV
jgi:hypothetical protein